MKTNFLFIQLFFLISFFCNAQQVQTGKSKDSPSNEVESIVEIKDSTFIIVDEPKDVYISFYKDGEPYEGYFKVGDDEIFWVERYKKGQKIKQYSFDILQMAMQMESGDYNENERFTLDKVGEYRNGKVYSGKIMSQVGNGFLTKTYKNGKPIKVVGDMFAMHYYNRFSTEVLGNDILFSHYQDSEAKIRFSPKNGKLYVKILVNDQVVGSNHFTDEEIVNMHPNFVLRAFKIDDQLLALSTSKNGDLERHESIALLFQRFAASSQVNAVKSDDPSTIIDGLLEIIFEENLDNFEGARMIAFLTSDEKGSIKNGIYWQEVKNENGIYKIYKNGNVIKEEKITLNDFQNLENEGLFEFE